MEKIWLNSYPAGVPHTVDPDHYQSLPHLLEESFRKNAARPFSVCMDHWMSYGQLDELSSSLGAWLQAQGLEPGARIAIMLEVIFGILLAWVGAGEVPGRDVFVGGALVSGALVANEIVAWRGRA